MSKYYDYLVANGASAEEAKLLDTPTSNRLYEKQQAELEAQTAAATKLDTDLTNYQAAVNKWHEENNAKLIQAQNDAIGAKAEEARHRAALQEAQKRGLFDVAKDLGWKEEAPVEAKSENISREEFAKIADSIGDNLAALEDMVMEHKQLFPDRPLSVRQLRKEALASGKPVHQYWEEKYKVQQEREAASTKQRESEIAKWKMEGAKEKETELISKFGNPNTRPLMPSQRPVFAARTGDAVREGKQPWDHADGQLQNDRVERVTKKLIERQYQN